MNLLASLRVQTAKKLFATATVTVGLGLGLGLSSPVHAQAFDPCTLYVCMAGISGEGASGGLGCTAAYTYWVAAEPAGLAVYDEMGFDPASSYASRLAYMEGCTEGNYATNAAIFQAIMMEWGYAPIIFP